MGLIQQDGLFYLTSPPEKDIEWTEAGADAAYRFLQKLWHFLSPQEAYEISLNYDHKILLCLKEYSHYLEKMAYNKAIAKIYEIANLLSVMFKKRLAPSKDIIESVLICLYPMIPFISYEIYQKWDFKISLPQAIWPDFSHISDETHDFTCAVQILGKLRGTVNVPKNITQASLEETVKKLPLYAKYIDGKTIRKIIYVKGKIINYVIS